MFGIRTPPSKKYLENDDINIDQQCNVTRSRLDLAKSYLIKGKLNLSNSRNIKTEIKNTITEVLEKLYGLIKESEAEINIYKNNNPKIKNLMRLEQQKEIENNNNKQIQDSPKNEKNENSEIKTILKLIKEIKTDQEKIKQNEPDKIIIMDEIMKYLKENKTEGKEIANHTNYDIITKIQENSLLIKENGSKLEELQKSLKQQAEGLEKMTYADAVVNRQNKRLPQYGETLHSIVVSSELEKETGEEILDKIRQAVNPKEGWVQVERVRKAKDRKIVMTCKTKEERKKVREKIEKAGQHLVVEEMKNKNPLLILKYAMKSYTDLELLEAFRNQNREIFQGLTSEEVEMKVRYKKKVWNPHLHHVVLMVTPTIWKRSLEKGKIKIDFRNLNVEDQSPLIQCTKCLDFGHTKRFCNETEFELCSHCGEAHLNAECPDKKVNEPAKCKNCIRAKSENYEHSAFSSECPVRKKWDRLARAAVAYC